jgi:histidine phosphotransfer protein HptB
MTDTSVLDPQAIENLRALNPGDGDEFLREIAAIFLDDTPQRIAELDQSLASADVTSFTRAAHSIKGSSSNMGASALQATAAKLEHRARTEGLGNVTDLVTEIKTEFGRAQTALAALIGK